MEFSRVTVDKLGIDMITHDPILLLSDENTGRTLAISIGIFEAVSIAFVLEGHEQSRPLCHDIFKEMLEQLDAKLLRVEIIDLVEDVFYTHMIVEDKDGNLIEIDSRPSDAIAIALRMDADIFVSDEILDTAGVRSNKVTQISEENGEDGIAHGAIIVSKNDSPEETEGDKPNMTIAKQKQEMEEIDNFLDGLSLNGLQINDLKDNDNGNYTEGETSKDDGK